MYTKPDINVRVPSCMLPTVAYCTCFELNLEALSVSDGHTFFASSSSLPVPVAHARGSQIKAPARH